jgi:hypothetical protein
MSNERGNWLDKGEVIRTAPPERSGRLGRSEEFASNQSLAQDPLTRLWRNADDRGTGAEAVERIRERKRQEVEAQPKRRRWWHSRT